MTEPTNPKDIAAQSRVPMAFLPAIGAVHGAQAIAQGLRNGYGPYNWRDEPISMLQYISAMERHIAALKDGENFTRDPVPLTHLGCINATTAIMLDAMQCGTMIDDRPVGGRAGTAIERYREQEEQASDVTG